jgi:hypothetical protein
MELLELTYKDAWGQHLRQVRDELQHKALQFVKEQRIRCLLNGTWFPDEVNNAKSDGGTATSAKEDSKKSPRSTSYKYVQLSHNRRYLHFADFEAAKDTAPLLDALPNKSKLPATSITQMILTVS